MKVSSQSEVALGLAFNEHWLQTAGKLRTEPFGRLLYSANQPGNELDGARVPEATKSLEHTFMASPVFSRFIIG